MTFLALLDVISLAIAVGATLAMPIVLVMRPRRFYLVRHGETLANAAHIYQGDQGGLSERGKQQARDAARFLAPFRVTRIVSSPYERARETAEIIHGQLRVRVVYSDLFRERRNPSEVVGKDVGNRDVEHIVDTVERAYHEDTFRYSDEENFVELQARAFKALAYLARGTRRSTCIVTHHKFLKMLVASMLYRKRLHASDFVKLSFFNPSDNAKLTICEHHPWKSWTATRGWKVIEYNVVP